MTYNILNSRLQAVPPAGLAAGVTDTTSTSLTLVGRDVANYGTFINQNFVRLIENFAGPPKDNTGTATDGPANPLQGQLWFDSTHNILKVWSGNSWKISTGATSSPHTSPPNDLSGLGGDLWYDTTNGQLNVWDSKLAQWITVGPPTPTATPNTGWFPALMAPTTGSYIPVLQLTFNGAVWQNPSDDDTPVYAIISTQTFSSQMPGFATIVPGINFSTKKSAAIPWTLNNFIGTFLTATTGGLQAKAIGNVTPGTGSFTTLSASSTTSLANVGANNITASSIQGSIGNVTPAAANFTTASAINFTATSGFSGNVLNPYQVNITTIGTQTNLKVSGDTILSTGNITALQAANIGNVTPGYGTFTTLRYTTLTSLSDANEKQQVQDLSAAELAVAKSIKKLIKKFKYNNDVLVHGNQAKFVFGVIAQEVQDAFTAGGLNIFDYNIVNTIGPNGQLGVSYDQLLAFVIASL
jgi:hypothetical protein